MAPSVTQPSATLTPSTSPTDIPTVTPSPIPTLPPTRTATITATPPLDSSEILSAIIQSNYWPLQGLDASLAAKWEAYASGEARLSVDEMGVLNDFLRQWQALNDLATLMVVTPGGKPGFRAVMVQNEQGQPRLIVYAVADAVTERVEEEQIYLIASDRQGKPVGLVLAPVIQGLYQRISADGRYVEYVELGGHRVLLFADAWRLEDKQVNDRQLIQRLNEVYPLNNDYTRSSIYPRFFFPVRQVKAGFFNLEKSITYNQILQMNEAFDLFNRPELEPLKQAFFGPQTSVLIIERLHIGSGLNYTGTGIVELDRKDLFGNRYYLAEVLAHEGSHVLQGRLTTRDACSGILKREVGDHTIPADFYQWTADDLVQAVKGQRIGAYHVSLWVLYTLGFHGWEINWLQDVIRTGQANGQSVVIDCR